MKDFLLGFLLRFLGSALIVLASYNPSGYSYFHWVTDSFRGEGMAAQQAFVGVMLLIGWTILVRATFHSLGSFGLVLAAAFIGTLVWLMSSFGLFEADTPVTIAWTALLSLAALLAVGMSWSHVRRRLTGQVDVDEIAG